MARILNRPDTMSANNMKEAPGVATSSEDRRASSSREVDSLLFHGLLAFLGRTECPVKTDM
jgi:hypothetical protein